MIEVFPIIYTSVLVGVHTRNNVVVVYFSKVPEFTSVLLRKLLELVNVSIQFSSLRLLSIVERANQDAESESSVEES